MVRGLNVPNTAIGEGTFHFSNMSSRSSDNWYYDGEYGHVLTFGRSNNPTYPYYQTTIRDISGQRMWVIDDKLDDGMPGTGIVRSNKSLTGAAIASGYCTDDNDPTATFTGKYRTDVETATCLPIFLLGF